MNLLRKELKLALHPTCIIFLCLTAMVMIPNYPAEVNYFYACLGMFFICLGGRENKDVYYSMLLPIRKRDIVKARFNLFCLVELAQILLTIPFIAIRILAYPSPNYAGLDANIAFLGSAFILFGIFNLTFLSWYYKDVNRVGRCFALSATVVFIYIMISVISTYAVPFVRDYLDTPDNSYLSYKLAFLAAGVLVYIVLTLLSYRISVKRFEQFDL